MLLGAGIRGDSARGDDALPQSPQEFFVPLGLFVLSFDLDKCLRNALIGLIDILINHFALLAFEAVLVFPNV